MGEPRSTRSPVTGWISPSSCPAPEAPGRLLAKLEGQGGSTELEAWSGSAELAPAWCTLYWKMVALCCGAGLSAGEVGGEGEMGAAGSSTSPRGGSGGFMLLSRDLGAGDMFSVALLAAGAGWSSCPVSSFSTAAAGAGSGLGAGFSSTESSGSGRLFLGPGGLLLIPGVLLPSSVPCFWLPSPRTAFPSFFWDSTASSSFLIFITLWVCGVGLLSGTGTTVLGQPPWALEGPRGTSFFSLSPPACNCTSFPAGRASWGPPRLGSRLLVLLVPPSTGRGTASFSIGLSSLRGERSRAESSSRSLFRLLASFQSSSSSSQVG